MGFNSLCLTRTQVWLSRCPNISTVGDNVGVADDSPTVLTQCREQAETAMEQDKPTSWIAAVVVVAIWLLLGFLAVIWLGLIL